MALFKVQFLNDNTLGSTIINTVTTIQKYFGYKKWYIQRYNIKDHFKICQKLIFKFSDHKNEYLGNHRTSLQLNNELILVSMNEWISCGYYIDKETDTEHPIEYFIQQYNRVPFEISFRLSNQVNNGKYHLNSFINRLLDQNDLIKKQ
jgi:hypothetical protein